MKNIIIISTPSGGKGTVSDYIRDKYNYDHISVGDLLRDEVEKNSEIGRKIKRFVDNGNIIGDETLFYILKNRLLKQKHNFISDGTPRVISQAKKYDELLNELDIELVKVIFIKTNKTVAQKRMKDRLVCENCNESYSAKIDGDTCKICNKKLTKRNDDNVEVFKRRYDTFIKRTLPVVDYYAKKGLVSIIENNTSLEELTREIDEVMRGV